MICLSFILLDMVKQYGIRNIKAFLMHCKKLSIEQLWAPPFIHDTSLSIIEIDNDHINIAMEGDIIHRSEELLHD